MKLEELIYKDEFLSDTDISDIEILNVSTNVNEINSGTLFVVIRSIKFDINKIISKVVENRPGAILCEDSIVISNTDIPVLRCKNSRKLLSFIYARFHKIDFTKTKFIAVTGTNGKTTTATILAHILSECGKRIGFIGTGKIISLGKLISGQGYSMTTPDPEYLYKTIKSMQDDGCEFIIMEVSSHALYFDKTAPITFEISIFTNLSPEHMDFHNSVEEYFNTKMKIFSQTKIGIFNIDDEYSHKAYDIAECKKTSVSLSNNADATATNLKRMGLMGTEFIYRDNGTALNINLSLGGDFNVYNSMMAIRAAIMLGAPMKKIENALSTLRDIDGRLEIIRDDITVVIDYAHTEKAFEKMLEFLFSSKKPEQKLIVVFGCGGERDKFKRPKMGMSAQKYSDFAIITTDNSRGEAENEIIEDILSGFTKTNKRTVIVSRKSAIEHAVMTAENDDIVAVIGKGHERYCYDKNGIHYFDEREIIKRALARRKKIL